MASGRDFAPGCCTLALLEVLGLIAYAAAYGQPSSEVDALVAFKDGLQDPQQAMDSWDASSDDPCAWFHVTCDTSNRVIRLDLGGMGISGTISSRLAELAFLQSLELFGNSLSGGIPKELGGIVSLVALHLSNNAITGSIPSELEQLSNLQFLNLSSNQLSGPVPTGGAFAKFSADSYAGNVGLCGYVINNPC